MAPSQLRKVSTGVKGLDEITGGGLPAGRATLICGGPGVQDGDDKTNLNISSLMDTWIKLKNIQKEHGLERQLFIVKSGGMAHSADVRRLCIGTQGIQVSERKEAK
jgi:KaiC/GvpD/RAD55 family RecA-like ATPase